MDVANLISRHATGTEWIYHGVNSSTTRRPQSRVDQVELRTQLYIQSLCDCVSALDPSFDRLAKEIKDGKKKKKKKKKKKAAVLRKELSSNDAAIKIQLSFRAYLIKKSIALRALRELAIAKTKLKEIGALFNNFSYRRRLSRDAEERQRFCEKIIVLLLRVDAIEGVDMLVRAAKKPMIDELEAMLDVVDPQPSGRPVSMQRRTFDIPDNIIQKEPVVGVAKVVMLDEEANGSDTFEDCLTDESSGKEKIDIQEEKQDNKEEEEDGSNKSRSTRLVEKQEDPPRHGALVLRQAFARRVEKSREKRKELTPNDAAIKIQLSFRDYLIKKSIALRAVRELAIAKTKLKEIGALFNNFSYRRRLSRDVEERQRFSEKIIVLLLTVDAIEGSNMQFRTAKKHMIDELEAMLDVMDSQPGGRPVSLRGRTFDNPDTIIQTELAAGAAVVVRMLDEEANGSYTSEDGLIGESSGKDIQVEKQDNKEEEEEDESNKSRSTRLVKIQEDPPHHGALILRQAFAKRVEKSREKRKELTPNGAAIKIQLSFRAYLIKRSMALRALRELAIAKTKLKEIGALFNNFSYRHRLSRDAEEWQRFSEKIVVLLLTVDVIEGANTQIRATKKAMEDALETMLDVVDPQPFATSVSMGRSASDMPDSIIQKELAAGVTQVVQMLDEEASGSDSLNVSV